MAQSNQDWKRDPIWQFIGVVVAIVTIFMSFLVLPSSVQGTALIGIVFACIVLAFSFVRKLSVALLLFLFVLAAFFGWMLIVGLTNHQVPFLRKTLVSMRPESFMPKLISAHLY